MFQRGDVRIPINADGRLPGVGGLVLSGGIINITWRCSGALPRGGIFQFQLGRAREKARAGGTRSYEVINRSIGGNGQSESRRIAISDIGRDKIAILQD